MVGDVWGRGMRGVELWMEVGGREVEGAWGVVEGREDSSEEGGVGEGIGG